MPHTVHHTRPALWTSVALLAVTATLLALFGCSGGSDKKNPVNPGGGGTPTSTSFTGILSSGAMSGKLTVTINTVSLARSIHSAPAAVVSASGVLAIQGGSTVSLTGSYDSDADTLYLAGGGYLLRGSCDAPAGEPASLNGTWAGPTESGSWGCVTGSTSTIKVLLGTFTAESGDYGTLDIVVYADTSLVGLAHSHDSPAPVPFGGSVSKDETSPGIKTITLSGATDLGDVLTGTGELTVATYSITGTWQTSLDNVVQDSGTWEAAPAP